MKIESLKRKAQQYNVSLYEHSEWLVPSNEIGLKDLIDWANKIGGDGNLAHFYLNSKVKHEHDDEFAVMYLNCNRPKTEAELNLEIAVIREKDRKASQAKFDEERAMLHRLAAKYPDELANPRNLT